MDRAGRWIKYGRGVMGQATGVVFALVVCTNAPAEQMPGPSWVVERFHAALIQVMKQGEELDFDARFRKLAPIVEEAFDLSFMARKSLGPHWKRLSEERRRRFEDLLRRLSVASYAARFNRHEGERFEYEGEEPADFGTFWVRTRLIRPEETPVEFDYRVRPVNESWKIVDIFLGGSVSELALRRSQYVATVRSDGFDALVAELEAKIADAAASD